MSEKIYDYNTKKLITDYTPTTDIGEFIYCVDIREDAEPLSEIKPFWESSDYVNKIYFKKFSNEEIEERAKLKIIRENREWIENNGRNAIKNIELTTEELDVAICDLYEMLIGE